MQSLGLIKRIFKYLTKESFLIIYKTYILPYLEYCVPISNTYLAASVDKLEWIQQNAINLVPELTQLPYMKQDYNTLTCSPCSAGDKEGSDRCVNR